MEENDLFEYFHSNLKILDGVEVAAEIGLVATIYFRGTSNPLTRQSVAKCFEIYRELAGSALLWVAHPSTGKFVHIRDEMPNPAESLRDLAPQKEWSFQYRGGTNPTAPNLFSVETFAPEEYGMDKLGYFRVTLPALFFAKRPDSFVDLVFSFCQLIQPEQGYAGLGIIESPMSRIRAKHEAVIYQLAKRFPGLEVDYPVIHSIWLNQQNGIKGVNWLTILGDRWVKEIGGVAGIKTLLSQDFLIKEYVGGALIKCGPRPQMGDMDKGISLELYIRLALILKRIRIRKHRMFHHPGPDRFNEAASEEWLARFDSVSQENPN